MKTRTSRAGYVKCKRCFEKYYRLAGQKTKLCSSCRCGCWRCDALLCIGHKDLKDTCKTCKEEINLFNKEEKVKDRALVKKYGITLLEYRMLDTSQNGFCWICRKPPKNVALSVDHKHMVGEKKRHYRFIRKQVRGLLCWNCNRALAKFKDSPEFLRKAADYLENLPAQKVLE